MDEAVSVWIAILGKAPKAGIQGLKAEEQNIYRAFTFVMQLEMGGASGVLYNLSPKAGTDQHQWLLLRQTATALDAIGDAETARLLLEASQAFEEIPDPQPTTWAKFMKAAGKKLPRGLLRTLESRPGEIYRHLDAYTRSHAM